MDVKGNVACFQAKPAECDYVAPEGKSTHVSDTEVIGTPFYTTPIPK